MKPAQLPLVETGGRPDGAQVYPLRNPRTCVTEVWALVALPGVRTRHIKLGEITQRDQLDRCFAVEVDWDAVVASIGGQS